MGGGNTPACHQLIIHSLGNQASVGDLIPLALAEIIDHLALCYIIVGSVSIVVAVVVYLLWLRTSILRIRRRIDTIYEVSSTFERCYVWVRRLLNEIVGGH